VVQALISPTTITSQIPPLPYCILGHNYTSGAEFLGGIIAMALARNKSCFAHKKRGAEAPQRIAFLRRTVVTIYYLK
jgi:hypothetical protein